MDRIGALVKHAGHEVSFEVTGAGELIAVGTANPVSEELYFGNKRKALGGRLMAVVRSSGQAGEIHVKASADGLAGARFRIPAK